MKGAAGHRDMWHSSRRPRLPVLLLAALLALLSSPGHAVPDLKPADRQVERRLQAALARQDEMVREAVAKLAPQRPGIRDIYFIGVAGWGDQDVFRLEVRSVRALMERSFGAEKRAVSLVNHPATLDEVPIATHETIEATIMAVAEVMDAQEDLLVLFMTSHGAKWNGFSLTLNGHDFGELMGAQLARILGASRIRNRLVIISACFSGQFVPAIAEEHTLLITSAASDRASFGCSSDAEWTWFGRAFFRDALPSKRRFVPAFEAATRQVEAREKREKYKPSVPQIRVGEKIKTVLDELGF